MDICCSGIISYASQKITGREIKGIVVLLYIHIYRFDHQNIAQLRVIH